MIGSIIVALGIFLIIIGFLFTISGSRKLSGSSPGKEQQYRDHDLYGSMSDNYTDVPESAIEDRTDHSSRSNVKGGGVIMIGPIPIIFGSDRKSAEIAIILAIVLMLLWFLFIK